MNQLSAKDALEKLRANIEDSIRKTEEVVLHAGNTGNYATALTLRSEAWGRKTVIYMINDMLDELKTPG